MTPTMKMLAIGLGLTLGACGGGVDEGEYGTSRLGESCATRSDCVKGLTCVDQVCVVDERTDRSCGEIEEIYLAAVLDDTAGNCAVSSDCFVPEGLCNATDDRAEAPPFLNESLEAGLETLGDEWDTNGCEQGKKCSIGTFGYAWCIQGTCGAGGACTQTLDALCMEASGTGCELFDGSSFKCESQVLGMVTCDPEAADGSGAWGCLDAAELDCSSEGAFVTSALTACGDVLGLIKP